MRESFIACAEACMYTMMAVVCSFIVFSMGWTLVFMFDQTTVSIWSMLWLNEWTTVVIGLAAGYFAFRFDQRHPLPNAAVTATLIELAHARVSGAFGHAPVTRILASIAIAIVLADAVVWLRSRLSRKLTPEATVPDSIEGK